MLERWDLNPYSKKIESGSDLHIQHQNLFGIEVSSKLILNQSYNKVITLQKPAYYLNMKLSFKLENANRLDPAGYINYEYRCKLRVNLSIIYSRKITNTKQNFILSYVIVI